MSTVVNKTKNSHLQAALENWVEKLSDIYERMTSEEIQAMSLGNRQQALWRIMDEFVRTFVPLDVTEDDIAHYRDSLLGDEEFFISLLRELAQCATGQRVESIQGDQQRKAIFTLLPPPELRKYIDMMTVDLCVHLILFSQSVEDGCSLDIVRELAFIAVDNQGQQWRAEVGYNLIMMARLC